MARVGSDERHCGFTTFCGRGTRFIPVISSAGLLQSAESAGCSGDVKVAATEELGSVLLELTHTSADSQRAPCLRAWWCPFALPPEMNGNGSRVEGIRLWDHATSSRDAGGYNRLRGKGAFGHGAPSRPGVAYWVVRLMKSAQHVPEHPQRNEDAPRRSRMPSPPE